ncbi:MAG: energy-coupling factor ABC transporter permease [Acidimicrobiia bacterium]|nr:energy-coupling factor ABC transporter permease [Acidimicrobiia bacterium]
MHIPDGFINGVTSLGAGVVAVSGLGASLRRAGKELQDRQIPLAGLIAAFVFVLQMLNFPVVAGMSGHLLGGALAAILIGPWMGMVVVSVVVIVQALLFADGGISALGLNIVNMGLLTVLSGWLAYRLLMAVLPKKAGSVLLAGSLAAWFSVVVSSLGFVGEYAIGGAGGAPLSTVLAAMSGTHSLIGIGEGLITAGVLGSVLAVRPDLVHGARLFGIRHAENAELSRRAVGAFIAGGVAVAILLVTVVAPRASSDPDGLERVAIDQGFAETATEQPLGDTPLSEYRLVGVEDEQLGTVVAGLIGLGVTFVAGVGLVLLARRSRGRVDSR